MAIIINCDLGENEPLELTESFLKRIDAANVCCGVHVGNTDKTLATLELAKKYDLMIGAHPGLAIDGGRGEATPTPEELTDLLSAQVESFLTQANSVGLKVSYIKLHGSLYHAVETSSALTEAYLAYVESLADDIAIFSLAAGGCSRQASAKGIRVYEEAFMDRAYQENGRLLPRTVSGAVLSSEQAFLRYCQWRQTGLMATHDGKQIRLDADTVCIHGDSPEALKMLDRLALR